METKSKIKIIQYHWGDRNHSYQMTRAINEAYCRRHGYEYVVKTFIPRDDRMVRWSKIPAMREELHDCNFLLYLDADAFFYSSELRIEEELLPLLDNKQIMMSADCMSEGGLRFPDTPNTGVILVRNTEKTAEILRVWDESSELPGMEDYRFGKKGEQDTCFLTVWQKYAQEVKLLKEYYLMNGVNGIFIRHLMSMSEEHRLDTLKKFVDTRRNGTMSVYGYLNTINTQVPKRRKKWGIGMLTTIQRTGGALARTLESYRGSGFEPAVVFTDLEQRGGLWNLHRALKSLLENQPDADAYMVCEDDVLFSKEMREYLESELWPSVGEHGCICSIFTPTIYSSEKRWHVVNHGNKTWMSQCRIYHPLTAKKIVADLENDVRLQNRWRQNDAVVGEWAKNNKVDIWFHSPSLIQHVASKSTSYGTNRSINYRLGMARDFVGEDRSLREYWADFGTEPRKIRSLPRLEIMCEGMCPQDGKKFLFTPEMARKLACKLERYNCDIEELSFISNKPLLWPHADQSLYLLRITGKILRTKMAMEATAFITISNLKAYELLFDGIDIYDDGIQPHELEKNISGNSFYTFLEKGLETQDRPIIPCLFGDHVLLCPSNTHQKNENPCSEVIEEKDSVPYWTLDDFFQSIDNYLSEFEQARTRKASQTPP